MRAKSIKNTARVNAELSPAELKALLKKAQAANGSYQAYIVALEKELAVWRSGGSVEPADYATSEKAGSAPAAAAATAATGAAAKKAPSTPTSTTPARSATPINPVLENLRSEMVDSRPQTPTSIAMDKDEREDFLRRENELADQLAEKV